MIFYKICLESANRRLLNVQMTFEHNGGEFEVYLPNWIPGSYLVRDFSRHIQMIICEQCTLTQISSGRWRGSADACDVSIRLVTYCNDHSVRECYVDDQRAFFNITSVCLILAGAESKTHNIQLDTDAWPSDWKVATGLAPESIDDAGFGHYLAPDYQSLADCPIEIGIHQRFEFEACGVPHVVCISGADEFDSDQVLTDLTDICEWQIRLFGEPAPVDRYWFLIHAMDEGYGGLEHMNSTVLQINTRDLPIKGAKKRTDDYLKFLELCSHEYFHTWNVKRIRPDGYSEYAFEGPQYTDMLWFFEGVTSYYDGTALTRSGVGELDYLLRQIALVVTRTERHPGATTQTLEQASFDAWTKFYKQDENAPNALANYYGKGSLVALCLDALIQRHSSLSLDDLMRELWANYKHGGAGVSLDGLMAWLDANLGEENGNLLRGWVSNNESLPVVESLDFFGFDVDKSVAKQSMPYCPTLNVYLNDELLVKTVLHHGSADRAGLASGDKLLALGGRQLTAANYADLLKRAEGQAVSLHYFRQGRLCSIELLVETTADVYSIKKRTSDQAWWELP
ncbi:MAG: M61 family metallopeptidase [Gammaproteobacteria bacterium]|nr:M61 family metallopeptidase [Gammaproteobacteria bacterium]